MMAVFSNTLSVALIIVCWWQAHQHVLRCGRLRRLIAASYGLTAITISSAALGRVLDFGQSHSLIWIKLSLLITLTLVAIRMRLTEKEMDLELQRKSEET